MFRHCRMYISPIGRWTESEKGKNQTQFSLLIHNDVSMWFSYWRAPSVHLTFSIIYSPCTVFHLHFTFCKNDIEHSKSLFSRENMTCVCENYSFFYCYYCCCFSPHFLLQITGRINNVKNGFNAFPFCLYIGSPALENRKL